MHKEALIGQLEKKIRQHSLEIGNNRMALIGQLLKYKRKMQFGDDLVDALALSCYEFGDARKSKPPFMVFY